MTWYLTLTERLPVLILLLASATSVVLGDYFAKRWSLDRHGIQFAGAILFYATSSLLYLPTLLREGLVWTSMVWVVLSTVGFLAVGLFIFGERLTTIQVVGIVLGFCSLVLLAMGDHS